MTSSNLQQSNESGNDSDDGFHQIGMNDQKLIGISWTTRLTIILIGTSILFSLFFGLEFLVSKLASLYSVQATTTNFDHQSSRATIDTIEANGRSISAPETCLVANPVNWTQFATSFSSSSSEYKNTSKVMAATSSSYSENNSNNNIFGINFDLIYEDELVVDREQSHFNHLNRSYPIRPDLKLNRLLRVYHIAMPFNPDIWLHSKPREQLHYLKGSNGHKCLQQLVSLYNQINDSLPKHSTTNPMSKLGGQHYKLMQLLDSYGRPEAGTLLGHPFWLGSYLQCEVVDAKSSANGLALEVEGEPLETRYCVGKMAMNSWKSEPEFLEAHPSLVPVIKIGLCLPKSCNSLELFKHDERLEPESNQIIEDIRAKIEQIALTNFNQRLYPGNEFNLTDVYCLPIDETRQLGAVAFMLITVLGVWFVVCLLCTWLRWGRQTGRQRNTYLGLKLSDQFVDIMAIDVNFRHLTSGSQIKQQDSYVDLSILDSVRHIGCMGVIAAHVLLSYLTLGTGYYHTIENIGKDMRTMLLLSLNNMVDTFFVVSGLLVAYLTCKKLDEHKKRSNGGKYSIKLSIRNYLKLVAGRYLRIAPMYLLVYTWVKSIAVHLGSGPIWDYATSNDSLRGLCQQESWLWPLAMGSDFKPITHHCIPPAWSLAVDLQFFLVMPLFIALLRRSTRFGYSVLGALIVCSAAHTMVDCKSLLNYVSLRDFAKLRLHVFTILIRYASHAYSEPQNRVGPILIGLVGGHLLYRYERRCRSARFRSRSEETPAITFSWEQEKQVEQMRPKSASPGKRISLVEVKSTSSLDNFKTSGRQNNYYKPIWMRGKWITVIILLNVLFMLAPTIVQVRERTRRAMQMQRSNIGQTKSALFGLADGEESHGAWINSTQVDGKQVYQNEGTMYDLYLKFLRFILALDTSAEFDCFLSLGGFVLIKPLWSICNCLLFLRLATDLSGSVCGRLLSLGWWHPLSKLNFAILLVHFELIAYEAMSRLTLQPTTWPDLLCKFAFAYLGSLCLALPLYVLIERPINRLVSVYLLRSHCGDPVPKRKSADEQEQEREAEEEVVKVKVKATDV